MWEQDRGEHKPPSCSEPQVALQSSSAHALRMKAVSPDAEESLLPLPSWQEAQAASGTDSAAKPQASCLLGSGQFWGILLTYPSPDMPEVSFQPGKPSSSLAHHQRRYDTPCRPPLVSTCLLLTLPRALSCTEIIFQDSPRLSAGSTPYPAYPTSQPYLSVHAVLL